MRKHLSLAILVLAMLVGSRWMTERPSATYFPTIIKSIQKGSIQLNNVTSNTATITAVNTASSVVIWDSQGDSTNGSGAADVTAQAVVLTNATTVTGFVNTPANTLTKVYFTVVEFLGQFVKSVQSGTLSGCATTATITSVNTARALIIYRGMTTTDSGGVAAANFCAVELTNATTVTGKGTQGGTPYYTVLEFK